MAATRPLSYPSRRRPLRIVQPDDPPKMYTLGQMSERTVQL
jgi:hypothetical protein